MQGDLRLRQPSRKRGAPRCFDIRSRRSDWQTKVWTAYLKLVTKNIERLRRDLSLRDLSQRSTNLRQPPNAQRNPLPLPSLTETVHPSKEMRMHPHTIHSVIEDRQRRLRQEMHKLAPRRLEGAATVSTRNGVLNPLTEGIHSLDIASLPSADVTNSPGSRDRNR
jgi:hypothetical protein